MGPRRPRREPTGALEPVDDQCVAQRDVDDLVEVGQCGLDLGGHVHIRRQVHRHATRNDAAPEQAIARQALVEAQQPLADPEAVRMGGGEPGIVRDHPEVRDVVVQPLQLQQDDAQVLRPLRHLRSRQGLQRLAVGERMPDRGIAGDSLGEGDALRRPAALEELLRTLVGEVEPRLHVDDRLAHHAEAEVAGLDHPGMDGAHRNLVDTLAAHLLERKRPPVVPELTGARVLTEGKVVFRPEPVPDQGPGIGMSLGADAEEIGDLTLESRGRVMQCRQRDNGRVAGRHGDGGVHEPVLAVREEVVNLEPPFLLPPVGRHHQHQLGAEGAKSSGHGGYVTPRGDAVQFVATDPAPGRQAISKSRGERRLDAAEIRHLPAISAACASRRSRGAGMVNPRTTTAARQRASGTRGQTDSSPAPTPEDGVP